MNASSGCPLTLVFIAAAALALLPGCGKVFENGGANAIRQSETDLPANVGVPASATATVTPNGKDLAVLSFSSIEPLRTETAHEAPDANVIRIEASLRSENREYSAVHVHEIENLTAADGVYSTDSALGCHYSIGDGGTPRAHVASVGGSCVETLVVSLPDHEIPRAFLGTTPLFSGEMTLADLKVVYAAAGFSPKLGDLLRTYVARLGVDRKPVTVADVAAFLPPLGNDPRRLDAVAVLAPRVSDAANAESLPKDAFTSAAARADAVKILSAYR